MNKREIKRQARELLNNIDNQDFELITPYQSVHDGGVNLESVFLGTVFHLCPSGKYYMPFACSNVEACNRCKGKGCDFCGWQGSRKAYEDSLFYEFLEEYAEKYHGGWIENGEGDPCDIFLVRYK